MSDSARVLTQYSERVYPRPSTFFVLILFVAMISIAYAAAISLLVGVVIFIGGFFSLLIGLWVASPVITVSGEPGDETLCVDRATIPLALIANPRLLDPKELASIQRGRSSDTAYLSVRGNLPAIALSIQDDHDPHELWVFSSRRPNPLLTRLGGPTTVDLAI